MRNLKSQIYPDMKSGPSLLVEGTVTAGAHIWHFHAWLHKWADGVWHLGCEDDPPLYRFHRRISACTPIQYGPHREASLSILRQLALVAETFANGKETVDSPAVVSTIQATVWHPRRLPTMENPTQTRCAIYTHYGKGERCSKHVAPGRDVCASHIYLESKLGPLPRQPVTVAPVETPAAPMIARATPDSLSAADFTKPAAKKATTKKVRARKAAPVAASLAVSETAKAS